MKMILLIILNTLLFHPTFYKDSRKKKKKRENSPPKNNWDILAFEEMQKTENIALVVKKQTMFDQNQKEN